VTTSTDLAPLPLGATGIECAPRGGADVFAGAEKDQHLETHIEHALLATGHRIFCLVRVSVRDRSVTLRGRVPSYYLKQLAQSVVLAAPGVRGLRNELAVSDLN
jgi:osmotically-inducible protein OsmY